MKTLAINGSPRGAAGNTDLILQNLLTGMRGSGVTTETIYLDKLNIKQCAGCFSCWFRTPGKCVFHDDMPPLLDKVIDADLVIYATPLYSASMTGLIKNFLDRLLPMILPFFVENPDLNGCTRHPLRYESNKKRKIFLVSTAGFPELRHFEALIHTFKHVAELQHAEYLGEILYPAAGLLKAVSYQDQITIYSQSLQIAGKQLAEHGKIDNELLAKLHEPLMSAQEYRDYVNDIFQKKLADKNS